MLQDFPQPATLPGGRKTGPLTDYSTYHALWEIAENLIQNCMIRYGQEGWQPAGMNQASLPDQLLLALWVSFL